MKTFTLARGTAVFCAFMLTVVATLHGQIFDDQFERDQLGAFWNNNGGWTIRSGQAYNGINGDWTLLTTSQSFAATSYVLETEVSNLVGGYRRAYYLLFGQQDDSGRPGYVFRYDPLGSGLATLGLASDNYLYPAVLDDKILDLNPTTAHRIRIAKYENGLIQVYIGDEQGFPDIPDLEAIDTTFPALSKVSWTTFTQSVGEEFFVEYIRADVPDIQKTELEKPAEDELVKQILVDSENAYELDRLTVGEPFYTDRPYTITWLPDFLEGARFIKTANDDKMNTDPAFLTAFIKQRAMAYVAFDPRASVLPSWLDDWTKLDATIGTTDPGSDYFELYAKQASFAAFGPTRYALRLGGALATPAEGTNMNYIVALLPIEATTRYEAEEALLEGAEVATTHPGFSGSGFVDYVNPSGDFIEWTVDVAAPGAYNLTVGFANGSNGSRPLRVSVNDQTIDDEPFGTTSSWSSWATRGVAGPILLEAGEHTVRLEAIGDSGPNVDYLQVNPSSLPARNTSQTALARVAPSTFSRPAVTAGLTATAYPNPTVDAITLEIDGADREGTQLRVIDAGGRRVIVRPLGGGVGALRERIDVSAWPAGTYVYQLANGGRVTSGRFVKLR